MVKSAHPPNSFNTCKGVVASKVSSALKTLFQEETTKSTFALLLSLRHDYPTEWSSFIGGQDKFTATLSRDHFPYFTQGREIKILEYHLYDGKNIKIHRSEKPVSGQEIVPDVGRTLEFSKDNDVLKNKSNEVYLIISYTLDSA